ELDARLVDDRHAGPLLGRGTADREVGTDHVRLGDPEVGDERRRRGDEERAVPRPEGTQPQRGVPAGDVLPQDELGDLAAGERTHDVVEPVGGRTLPALLLPEPVEDLLATPGPEDLDRVVELAVEGLLVDAGGP